MEGCRAAPCAQGVSRPCTETACHPVSAEVRHLLWFLGSGTPCRNDALDRYLLVISRGGARTEMVPPIFPRQGRLRGRQPHGDHPPTHGGESPLPVGLTSIAPVAVQVRRCGRYMSWTEAAGWLKIPGETARNRYASWGWALSSGPRSTAAMNRSERNSVWAAAFSRPSQGIALRSPAFRETGLDLCLRHTSRRHR